MQKRIRFVIGTMLFMLLLSPLYGQHALKLKTVVIDPGHGGKDPGAVGKLAKEKDVVLAISLKLGNYIEKYLPDVKVIYTRKTDVFVPLNERAEIANANNADLFLSIHANYIANPRIYGTETFVLGLHRSEEHLEVAKKENSVIVMEEDYTTKYEGFDPNVPESYIIFELMQNVYLDQSIQVASLVQNQFHQRVGRKDRGVKQAGFLVLRSTSMPGVLIETGFLSNRIEERFLTSSDGQTYLASAIYRAFRDYKKEFESKSLIVDEGTRKATVTPEPKVESSVLFRIQVTSSRKEIKPGTGIYKRFDDVWMYRDGNRYKYTTGCSSNYKEISALLKKTQSKVSDSFIVAFEDEKRLPLDEALKKVLDSN